MSCAFWNGAAASPSAAFPPYLSALDDGVSEKQRRYSPTCDEKREKRERLRYSGHIDRDSFLLEHQAQNTPGPTSKANCSVVELILIRLNSITCQFVSVPFHYSFTSFLLRVPASSQVPNVQPGGPLLELLVCIKGRAQAFVGGQLGGIQS